MKNKVSLSVLALCCVSNIAQAQTQRISTGWGNWLELTKTDITPNTAWVVHSPNPLGPEPTRLEFGYSNGSEIKWGRFALTEENVGIGTPIPLAKLHVANAGGVGVFSGDLNPFGVALFESNASVPKTHAWFAENGNRVFSVTAGGAGYFANSVDVIGQVRATTLLLTSDRSAKGEFQSVDSREVLKKVASLPLSTWHYTNAAGVRHLGPMAQDFKAAFNLGEDDKHIATVDADGVALASIQALYELVQEKDSEIAALKQQVSALKIELTGVKDSVSDRLAALEKAMTKDTVQASFQSEAAR